jgi:hypothetical protein
MVALPFLDPGSVADAHELIAMYGDDAGYEAASRADASRDRGNAIHFARWRQIERLIVLLSVDEPFSTIH